MTLKKLKFVTPVKSDFSATLRERVNHYFKTNDISRHSNISMVLKTTLMLTAFLGPFIVLNSGLVENIWLLFGLYVCSGLGMAGVGMAVMHDANHGSYSKNKNVNKYLGYTMNLIGANASVWKIQHNVLHHTYTNIEGLDDDINAPFFLRFSPNAKRYWVHKFQFLYVWLFYGLSTLSWITTKDYIRMSRYKKLGFFNKQNEFRKEMYKLTGWKVFYFSFAIVGPLIILPFSPWLILLAFCTMHFVTGLVTSIIFQLAHVIPSTKFTETDESDHIASDWFIHQLETTANYSPKSRFFSWLIGGLNYQIEHHLFPNICHVHYRKLSKIVKKTAEEYNLPYLTHKSFGAAFMGHVKMLYQLGRSPIAASN